MADWVAELCMLDVQGCEESSSVWSTSRWLQQVVTDLQSSAGWRASHMHLFGFSQGGTAALHLALQHRFALCMSDTVCVIASMQSPSVLKKRLSHRLWAYLEECRCVLPSVTSCQIFMSLVLVHRPQHIVGALTLPSICHQLQRFSFMSWV